MNLRSRVATVAVIVLVAVIVCHLLAQGSFYWFSGAVSEPTVAGWWKNYSDWLLPYMRVAALYVAVVLGAHAAIAGLLGQREGGLQPR